MAYDYSFGPGPVINPETGDLVIDATGQVYAEVEGGTPLTVRVGGGEVTDLQVGDDGILQQFFADVASVFVEFPGVTRYRLDSFDGVVTVVTAAQAAAEDAAQAAWDAVSSGGGGGDVSSVNGQTGAVVLSASDVGALPASTPLFSGRYSDLSGKPTIPSTPQQVGAATAAQGARADTAVQGVVAGANVFVDNSDPTHPVISASGGGGGGGGDVLSVNGKIGNVVLSAADVGAQPAGDYLVEDDLDGYATVGDLNGKADTGHTHTVADVSGLQAALDGKQPAGSYATATQGAKADSAVQPSAIANMVTGAGVSRIETLTQAAYDALDPKEPTTLYIVVG